MKLLTCLSIMFLGLQTACESTTQENDADKIKAVLTGYFDGVTGKDLSKLKQMTTLDYILFEGGRVWNNDSLINFLKKRPDLTVKFKFDNMNIRAGKQFGRIIYYNHGDFFVNDTLKRSTDWVESATFRKVNGKWKMEFLHSTDRKK